MSTDPKKKKKKTTTRTVTSSYRNGSQQLSDALARKVSKGTLTYAQAQKIQKERDAKVGKTTKVYKTTRTSSAGLPSKRKATKARYKIDPKTGKRVAY